MKRSPDVLKQIPNALSFFRIVLIPFFIGCVATGHMAAAAVLLLVSGATDILDGVLARRFGWVTDLGKVLDPLADKLTQITVCVAMIVLLRPLWPLFALLLAKEAVMIVAGARLIAKGVKIEGAKWFGKISTFAFFAAMFLILLIPSMPRLLILALVCIVVVLSLISGILYLREYLRFKRSRGMRMT